MSNLAMSLSLRQAPEITGGSTGEGLDCALPRVAAWLNQSSDHWGALEFVAARKDMERYRSVVDFILCEVCPDERAACERFYAGRGGILVAIRSAKTIAYYEARCMLFLEICYAAHCEQRRVSWAAAVAFVNEAERTVTLERG